MGKIVGVDDAGRGCIIGPLVVAGVLINEDKIKNLVEVGVKDSKLLSYNMRNSLSSIIKRTADEVNIQRIPVAKIDKYVIHGVKNKKLNYLEALTMGKVVRELDADVYYIDASDVNPNRFGKYVLESSGKNVKIISVHKADQLYPVVSASSIIAKVERDRAVKRLKKIYGDFGSGYPSDRKTREFLIRWIKMKGTMPPFSRRSWKTWETLTRSLDEFK